ncbi:MAG TPA: hypothetical protein VEG67_01285 [Myxococcota bacterium]|nr:hypothetical protein [Myxococcota bacterium]
MRDRTLSFVRLAVCAGIAACALGAAASRAEDPFGPDPLNPEPKPALQCPAGLPTGPDLQSRIAEIQRQIVNAGGGIPTDGSVVLLNGAGYNYPQGSGDLDQAALSFEAKQAR